MQIAVHRSVVIITGLPRGQSVMLAQGDWLHEEDLEEACLANGLPPDRYWDYFEDGAWTYWAYSPQPDGDPRFSTDSLRKYRETQKPHSAGITP